MFSLFIKRNTYPPTTLYCKYMLVEHTSDFSEVNASYVSDDLFRVISKYQSGTSGDWVNSSGLIRRMPYYERDDRINSFGDIRKYYPELFI